MRAGQEYSEGMATPPPAAIPSTPSPLSARRRNRMSIIALLGAGLAVLLVATPIVFRLFDGPPYQMVIEPEDDHAIVRFTQAGARLFSKPFRIDHHVERREVVVLDSPAAKIPGGSIVFADTTVMPGKFTIRIGEKRFDVMSRGIEVDGESFDWLEGDQAL